MNEHPAPEPSAEYTAPAPTGRRPGSAWMLVVLLLLLGGWFVTTQILSRTGPPIEWIHNDLPKAEQLARAKGQRIFLLLHEPGCKVTEANDRDLFSQRTVRERLVKMVCCRVELKPDDPLRWRFNFKNQPLMLVLEPGRDTPLARLEGKVDQLQFKTYVESGHDREGG